MNNLSYDNGSFYARKVSHDFNEYGQSWANSYTEKISEEEARMHPDFYPALPLNNEESLFFEINRLKIKKIYTTRNESVTEIYKIRNGNYFLYLNKGLHEQNGNNS